MKLHLDEEKGEAFQDLDPEIGSETSHLTTVSLVFQNPPNTLWLGVWNP